MVTKAPVVKSAPSGSAKKGGLLSFLGLGKNAAAPLGNAKPAPTMAPASGGKKSFLSALAADKKLPTLLGLAGLFLLLTIVAIYFDARDRSVTATHMNVSSQLQYHTQRLAKAAGLAARGEVVAFAQLEGSRDEFDQFLKVLKDGGTAFNTEVRDAKLNEELTLRIDELSTQFEGTSAGATAILAAKKDLTDLAANVARARLSSEELAAQSQDLSGIMQQSGVPPIQVLRASRMSLLAERLGRGTAELSGADEIAPEVPFLIGKDTTDFRDLLQALESGSTELGIAPLRDPEGRARVEKLREQFSAFEKSISPILGNVQKLVAARQSGRVLQQGSEALLSGVTKVQAPLAQLRSWVPLALAILFGALTLLTLAWIAFTLLADARQRAAVFEAENARNQAAILRLLNEMGDLADGDLTVRAKVTEDITGAIADSMNYTIEELRTLVTGVNAASSQVSLKSQQAQAVSVQLLSAAEKQSQEIQNSTQDVLNVAATLTSVSASAEESSGVAARSLVAADKGRKAVQNSISGMNEIRVQIQDTSKRIKRLGESSQEISEIVELISDITEQTNVLALNAAIQAASAGEAGRGFSVVAEEVQRLAERSGEATKQISAIVKSIQADTQDAVAAMEKSTTGVVEGAKLSDAAGQALNEIDTVTKNLAQLIQKISTDTRSQVVSANKVAKNMQDILEVTQQTTSGTQQTASSIKDLADVANSLKASVAGFKL